jgi:hypothetical protein
MIAPIGRTDRLPNIPRSGDEVRNDKCDHVCGRIDVAIGAHRENFALAALNYNPPDDTITSRTIVGFVLLGIAMIIFLTTKAIDFRGVVQVVGPAQRSI